MSRADSRCNKAPYTDFIDASKPGFVWVSNIADASIDIGIGLCCSSHLWRDAPRSNPRPNRTSARFGVPSGFILGLWQHVAPAQHEIASFNRDCCLRSNCRSGLNTQHLRFKDRMRLAPARRRRYREVTLTHGLDGRRKAELVAPVRNSNCDFVLCGSLERPGNLFQSAMIHLLPLSVGDAVEIAHLTIF